MRTKIEGLLARVGRLEKLAGKGACPECRLLRRHSWIDPTKPRPNAQDPSLLVTTLCELCGALSTSDLSGYPEDVRELPRLYYTFKLEDTFTDPRAWAAQRWVTYWSAAERQARKVLRELRRLSESAESAYARQQRDYARRQRELERERARKKDPDVKLYNELLAEAQAFYKRRLKRLERRYSAYPFPELEARLKAVEGPDYNRLYKGEPYERDVPFSPLYEIREEGRLWQACAELEKIIVGEVTATTAGRLADCEGRAREVVAAARAKHEAREGSHRREAAAREFPRVERPAELAFKGDAALPESPYIMPIDDDPLDDHQWRASWKKAGGSGVTKGIKVEASLIGLKARAMGCPSGVAIAPSQTSNGFQDLSKPGGATGRHPSIARP